jgi:hypothetical protein
MPPKRRKTDAAHAALAAQREEAVAGAEVDAGDDVGGGGGADDGGAPDGGGDGGGADADDDVVALLVSLRGAGGRKRLRASGVSSAAPADATAATRYALSALRAAAASRIRARQAGWRVPVVVPGTGGAVSAVVVPTDGHGRVQRIAVTASRRLRVSVNHIHAVRAATRGLQAALPRSQAAAVAAIAAASVAAYELSRALYDGVGAANRRAGALTAPMLDVSERQLRSVQGRLRSRRSAVPRQGKHVRAKLADDPAFVAGVVSFMLKRYTSGELRALHLVGTLPSAARPARASIRPNVADATSFANWALQGPIAHYRRRQAGLDEAAADAAEDDGGKGDDGAEEGGGAVGGGGVGAAVAEEHGGSGGSGVVEKDKDGEDDDDGGDDEEEVDDGEL